MKVVKDLIVVPHRDGAGLSAQLAQFAVDPVVGALYIRQRVAQICKHRVAVREVEDGRFPLQP
jgi:hypothetical protein